MKNIKYFNIIACVIAIILFSINCTDKEIIKSENRINKNDFNIQEFKDYWENQVSTRYLNEEKMGFTPSNYIPVWDKFILSENGSILNVELPIQTEIKYKILQSEIKHQNASVHKVDVIQKIVFAKNTNTKKISQYLVTLIPKHNRYGILNTNVMNSKNSKYEGWIFYSLPFMKAPFKIEKYIDGEKVLSIIIPKSKDKKALSIKVLKNILGNMQIATYHSITTRSSEDDYDYGNNDSGYEDFFDWFEQEVWPNANDGDHLTMENDGENWWLQDQNGNEYEIPEGLVTNDDIEIDTPEDNITPDYGGDGGQELAVWLQIFHRPCGTYLGMVDFSTSGSGTYYCPTCKIQVHVVW